MIRMFLLTALPLLTAVLSANDVILKNGKVITNVKATVLQKTVRIEYEDGRVEERSKAEIRSNQNRPVVWKKTDTDTGKESTRIPSSETAPNEKWSPYQGAMSWNDAKAKCESIGMRLPARNELLEVFRSSRKDEWLQTAGYYWSSEEKTSERACSIYFTWIWTSIACLYEGTKDSYGVRCIR